MNMDFKQIKKEVREFIEYDGIEVVPARTGYAICGYGFDKAKRVVAAMKATGRFKDVSVTRTLFGVGVIRFEVKEA